MVQRLASWGQHAIDTRLLCRRERRTDALSQRGRERSQLQCPYGLSFRRGKARIILYKICDRRLVAKLAADRQALIQQRACRAEIAFIQDNIRQCVER